jgi:hypothetical protein
MNRDGIVENSVDARAIASSRMLRGEGMIIAINDQLWI